MIEKLSKRVIGIIAAVSVVLVMTGPLSAAALFSDNFEGNTDGADPVGWTVTEDVGGFVSIQPAPGWSPFGKTVQLNTDSLSTEGGASISKDGFNIGADFVLEFDMLNLSTDRNGVLTILLLADDGTAIFSGQVNYSEDPETDYFDTGLHNATEPDQRYTIPSETFAGSPPYPGLRVKVAVHYAEGTYDLLIGTSRYIGNALGSNAVGKNLAKIEFIGGEGSAKSTNVWLDNVVLDVPSIIFTDNFEGETVGENPSGWIVAEPEETDTSIQEDINDGYGKVVQLHDPLSFQGTAMDKMGLDIAEDFVFEFDMKSLTPDRNGVMTMLLLAADGTSIFSAQVNIGPTAGLGDEQFQTGIYNSTEADQAFTFDSAAWNHIKIEVNQSTGTYDLTIGEAIYANNPLGSSAIGKNLTRVEFIGGEASAFATTLWLDNIMLTVPSIVVDNSTVFNETFENDTASGKPAGWTYAEAAGANVSVQQAPSWSPYGKVVQLYANGSATDGGASISKDGFDIGDFVFEFDVLVITHERNGVLTVLLTEAGGESIFSAQINYSEDPATDYFDTGVLNLDEVDQRFTMMSQQFLTSPPYPGVHVKVAVNHAAGTYDLMLDNVLYANNPLGANVIGKNLAKVEFIGGVGSNTSTNVWVDNIKLIDLTAPAPVQIPGDANDDGMVDVGDLGILAANYGGSGKTWAQGDFNGDGLVDVGDLGILAAHYGEGVNGSVDFSADYAKAFGTTVEEDDSADETGSSICSGLGLPIIAGLALMGLMLVKLEE